MNLTQRHEDTDRDMNKISAEIVVCATLPFLAMFDLFQYAPGILILYK